MNSINIGGKRLKIVRHNQPLFRANRNTFTVGLKASTNYRGAPIKYFTLNEDELKAYTKYGMPYKKTWEPESNLVLIDILDLSTRRTLGELIGEESLQYSFPIVGRKVSRVSEEDAKEHDDNVLKAICMLDPRLDGYYMRKLTNNNGEQIFHSEVGLCPGAYDKLKLTRVKRNVNQAAPAMKKQGSTRRRNNNNMNNTRRKPSRFFSLLNNSPQKMRNNNDNENMNGAESRSYSNSYHNAPNAPNNNMSASRRLAFF
jgi:hypothetical protein